MKPVSLNVDLGELEGEPEALYSIATVANVACGGHAGDAATMARAVELALSKGTRLAAHPSYPDRAGFGRTSLRMEPDALFSTVFLQIDALAAVARKRGAVIVAVKPHGALYHDAARDPALARILLDAAIAALSAPERGPEFALVGPPRGALADLAAARQFSYWREGFADRAYRKDGRLVPRTEKGALIEDPEAAAAQALALAESGELDTICFHGDTPGAVNIGRAARTALQNAGLLERR